MYIRIPIDIPIGIPNHYKDVQRKFYKRLKKYI